MPMQMAELGIVLLCAAVAMVAADLASGTFWLRYWFNRWMVTRWLADGLAAHGDHYFPFFSFPWNVLCRRERDAVRHLGRKGNDEPPFRPNRSNKSIEHDLAHLAVGGRRRTLYRVGVDQMAAQVNAAAEGALDYPSQYALLLCSLCGIGMEAMQKKETIEDDAEEISVFRSYVMISSFRSALDSADSAPAYQAVGRERQKAHLLDQRARLGNMIQRRIDDLQITARSSAQLRDLSLYVGAGFAAASLLRTGQPIATGLAAGFLAPLMHDLRSFLRQPR